MTKNGEKIINKIKSDAKLQEKLKNCKSTNEVIKILNDNNLKCTLEDFNNSNMNKKMSLEELKKVSGGTACVCVIVGFGYQLSPSTYRCACVESGYGDGECWCLCLLGGGGEDK